MDKRKTGYLPALSLMGYGKKADVKIGKLKVLELKPDETFVIKKRHALRPVTTRTHYPGLHKIQIQINGKILASADWHLELK